MAKIQDIDIPYLEFAEAAAPGTPAAGIVRTYAKADGLLYSKDDAGTETLMSAGGGSGDLAGKELDYVEKTSNTSITAVAGVGADTVLTGASVAYDGATVVLIEFFAPNVNPSNDAAGRIIYIRLFEDGTELGALYASGTPAASFDYKGAYGARRLTPSNASHTYSIRANLSASPGPTGGAITAGTGTGGAYMPCFMRITRVSS